MHYKPLKINRKDYDQILFCSDQHKNHNPNWTEKLHTKRGFNTLDAHDAWLDDQFGTVTPNSLIISIGDPALNSSVQSLFNMWNRTGAQIFHFWGNHYSNDYAAYKTAMHTYLKHGKHRVKTGLDYHIYPFSISPYTYLDTYEKGLERISGVAGIAPKNDTHRVTFFGESAIFNISGKLYHCRHMAPLIWDRMKHDQPSIVGHSHGSLHIGNPNVTDGGKILDCGIENSIKYNGKAFFTIEEVDAIMSKKHVKTFDHHG